MHMHCKCWMVGAHMACTYLICIESGWLSLRVFKCSVGYLSSVSAILDLLLRAKLALVICSKFNFGLTVTEHSLIFTHILFLSKLLFPGSGCISGVTVQLI